MVRTLHFHCQGHGSWVQSLVGELRSPKQGGLAKKWKMLHNIKWAVEKLAALLLSCQSESESEVAQSCPTLCDPMDCSPSGSSIHGILQARILQWLSFLSPGDLPNPGVEPRSPALQADALTSEPPGKLPKIVLFIVGESQKFLKQLTRDWLKYICDGSTCPVNFW